MKLFFLVGFIFVAFLVHTYAEETGAKDCIIDLQLIVDSSGSVGEDHFNQMMEDIAEKFLRSFHIGPLQTRVGLFQYSNLMRNEFDLDKFSDVESLIKATEAIKYIGGETYTGQAMNESLVHFEEKMRKDNETKKVCIVFTDGAPTERKEAIEIPEVTRKWRDLGVHVFAVGIGPDILHTGLVAIAGNEDNALSVVDFSNLTKSIEPLKKIICTLPQITSPPQYPANTTPIPPIPPIPSLDPTVKVLGCGDDPCCSESKVRVECLCHNDDEGFQFKLLVNDSLNSYAAEFGPNARVKNPGEPCITNIRDWDRLDANKAPWTHQIQIGIGDCETKWTIDYQYNSGKYEKSVIQFSNTVRVFQQIKSSSSDIITDELNVTVTCDCTVEGNITYQPTPVKTKMIYEVGKSSSNIKLDVKCGNKKDPEECCLKENICVSSNWGSRLEAIMPDATKLEIFALNCWADTDGEIVSQHQDLIKEGCGSQLFGMKYGDDDDDDNVAPGEFCFQAFRFPDSNNKINIHCQIMICEKNNPNSECTKKRNACKDAKLHYSNNSSVKRESQRRKRSVNMGSYVAMQEVMVGPIVITDAPNMSYAAKVVSPRRKFAGVRRRLDRMMRKLSKSRG